MNGSLSQKHVTQSESSESVETRWAASFIGLNFKNPWEGRPVCLSFRVRSVLTDHLWLSVGRTGKQKKIKVIWKFLCQSGEELRESKMANIWNRNVRRWCTWIHLNRLVRYCVCECGELSSQRFVSGAGDLEKTKLSMYRVSHTHQCLFWLSFGFSSLSYGINPQMCCNGIFLFCCIMRFIILSLIKRQV